MPDLPEVIELCKQIADGLDGSCLVIDEFGQKSKNATFEFPCVIDHTNDAKDAELYDIDTEKLLFILDVELKRLITNLLHYSPGNGQKLESEFEPIKKWANSLNLSAPRPSKIRLPRMADYPGLVIENIGRLTFHLPERANEIRRVAGVLTEGKAELKPTETSGEKPAGTEEEKGGQGNGGEADSAKEQTAGTWYLRLYEITLKVLVDAVLERVWPKVK